MTATERVRELLDERGVEWTEGIARPELTQVRVDGKVVKFHSWQPNTLKVSLFNITPEQAIAATLGRGTCHITRQFTCSECEYQYPTRNYECYETCDGRTAYASLGYYVLDCEKPNYCPNCGRKVVDE